VIDFSGQAAAPAVGAALLRRGGRLVLGSIVDATLTLGTSSTFAARELQMVGAYVSSLPDLAAVIELTQAGHLDPSPWVSHRLPLAEFERAVALAQRRPEGMVRVVVEPGWQ
jgi:L-iditol 2-dehydrogenase